MKLLFSLIVVALSACATATPPRQSAPVAIAESPNPGTVTITGDQLKQTGRTELSDALRASSPIFH
jgi:hypothetical protein